MPFCDALYKYMSSIEEVVRKILERRATIPENRGLLVGGHDHQHGAATAVAVRCERVGPPGIK